MKTVTSKSQNAEALSQEAVESIKKDAVAAEQPKTETTAPVIKQTPVEERLYAIVPRDEEVKFRGKQRTIVYNELKTLATPATIKTLALLCEKAGLSAVGGVEPSVRYHLHHLTNDKYTEVTNPTITIE